MFIVLAPLIGMIVAYIIAQWFIYSFRKSIWTKLISVMVILGVVFGLRSAIVTETSRIVGMKFEKGYTGKGLQVSDILTSSPAQTMGLKKGDVILGIDNQDINDKKQFDNALLHHATKSAIAFRLLRKDNEQNIASVYHTSHESRFLDVLLYGENLKWILVSLIILTMATTTLFLSRLNYATGTKVLKRMQLVSSAAFSIGHGGNDAQKVMGIIMAALVAYDPHRYSLEHMETWVPLACYTAISLGTLSGGWKIIKTMGSRITKVTPFEGVAAETAGAITLFFTEQLKIPVSTTHTITGSIIGVGATKRLSAVRWGVTINLLWAWILTIPVSAVVAMLVYFVVHFFAQ